MRTIMVVEDEPAISRVLAAYIKKAGYECAVFTQGELAVEQLTTVQPALILLDVMLPGLDGWEVLREVRNRSTCPVIMLTAKGEIGDRLLGLNSGADDYIIKPFEPVEVIARIQAILRRPSHALITDHQKQYGSLRIDFKSRSVSLNGETLSLTPKDLALLLFLAEHPNQIFHREQLIERVWGIDYDGSDRAVDHAIKRLRQSLHPMPPEDGGIRTLRGTGYQFYANGAD
ncbi:two component transcriptional regulator, winged helix family [Paenibacillus curdlanolyticus YK9]|uniref:Two component transcriptional regulator, winged helix family n=1 Tax=Paenibacillus curdlanolyticus YK9 TaxID=717606 RepID=E0IG72_9BACL|nr:response regulator transcription factor [Paenibacillus curdlanolyticus]EFM08474.1 two component transcriptional regulator, winged helix family [Paenibacillus curdlanolyticus YK9]